jgi:hypothetical protein
MVSSPQSIPPAFSKANQTLAQIVKQSHNKRSSKLKTVKDQLSQIKGKPCQFLFN